ncbi:MAG: WG repeat-containing protein [Mucinivorans sp.]
MTYPTISMYIAAMENPRNFQTLLRVELMRDKHGEVIFRSSRHSVTVAIRVEGVERTVRLRIRSVQPAEGNVAVGECLKNELLVPGDGGVEYYDLWLGEPFSPSSNRAPSGAPSKECENRCAIERNGLWGFADALGRMVIDPIYDRVEDFSEGRAVVERGGYCGLIDIKGKVIIDTKYEEVSYDGSHLCYVEYESLCGVVDRLGRVVVEPRWDWVAEFSRGLLLVERDGLFGYVDMEDRQVIEPQYENATSFDEYDYAWVTFQGMSYEIDKEQNRV